MTWEGNPRTTTPLWRKTRLRILTRDHGICHICGGPGATQVDHIIAIAEGGTDSDDNLAPIHPHPCHAHKSSAEGHHARWATRATRTPEPHPGLRQ